MRVLVTGNGFDLAHGLKTNFMDFLPWSFEDLRKNKKIGVFNGFDLSWRSLEASGYVFSPYRQLGHYVPDFADELFKKVNTWTEFESNLKQVFEEKVSKSDDKAFKSFCRLFEKYMLTEFEEYIASVINSTQVMPVYDENKFSDYDVVINLNNSNTFERLYGLLPSNQDTQYFYINGKAKPQNQANPTSNIVFGCDYYRVDDGERLTRLSVYHKTFQRAYKKTDLDYKRWFKENENSQMDIDIIGCSMSRTDHSILRRLICNGNNSATIYYHDEESHRMLIHKVIDMVGIGTMHQRIIDFSSVSSITA